MGYITPIIESMGDIDREKKERNLELFQDYKLFQQGKMEMIDIMQKYDLSVGRIYYLVGRMKKLGR